MKCDLCVRPTAFWEAVGHQGELSSRFISAFAVAKYSPRVCSHPQVPTREQHQWPPCWELPAPSTQASGQHKQLNYALFPPLKSNHRFASRHFVMLRNVLSSCPHWPERSRGRWRTQSRSRRSRCRTPSLRFLRACRRDGYWGRTTWSRATPRPLHSWRRKPNRVYAYKWSHSSRGSRMIGMKRRSEPTWRGGSRPARSSGSCCDDLWPSRRSAQCFRRPEEDERVNQDLWNKNHRQGPDTQGKRRSDADSRRQHFSVVHTKTSIYHLLREWGLTPQEKRCSRLHPEMTMMMRVMVGFKKNKKKNRSLLVQHTGMFLIKMLLVLK